MLCSSWLTGKAQTLMCCIYAYRELSKIQLRSTRIITGSS